MRALFGTPLSRALGPRRFAVIKTSTPKGLVAIIAVIGTCASIITFAQSGWRLPLTIEVTRDVPVRSSERKPDGPYGQERGTLYSSVDFLIRQGQRFRMIDVIQEGACRIRFENAEYELSSCPWLPGFSDSQADIFRILDEE